MKKAIINGKIILPNEIVENKILLFDSKIIGIFDELPQNDGKDIQVINAKGKYVSPGLIDIHIHGNIGYDFMDVDLFEIEEIEKSIASKGVTGYLATTMTMNKEKIYNALDKIKKNMKLNIHRGAKPLGVHLEGPFLNEKYKGAQDSKFIIPSSYDFIKEYEDIIKVITYAPENDKDLEFTKYISQNTNIILSMGHTNATYLEALEAINNGVKHATHLFNAMTGLNHRDPGVVGASLLSDNVKCELIADNIHVNKDLYELLVKSKGIENIILVTDSMEASNMCDGVYSIGGHPVKVENGSARLVSNGVLAGSVLNLNTAIKNFYDNTSLKLNEVIRLSSLNPAKSLHIDDIKGSLEIGKDADIAIFDENMECFMTIVEGEIKYEKLFNILDIKNKLSSLPNKIVKTMNGRTLSNEYGSYRGNYSNLYIEINSNDKPSVTSYELIELLNKSLKCGVMHGYKGGEFDIKEDTLVVLATYGESTGYYIKDIYIDGDYIIIEHKEKDKL